MHQRNERGMLINRDGLMVGSIFNGDVPCRGTFPSVWIPSQMKSATL
jgi:hypothetical protein